MYDLAVSFAASLFISLLLLKKLNKWAVLLVSLVIGLAVGWQVLNLLPASNTSFGYLLATHPELKIIWEQTHDILEVIKVARYAYHFLVGFNGLAALLGYFVASKLERRI